MKNNHLLVAALLLSVSLLFSACTTVTSPSTQLPDATAVPLTPTEVPSSETPMATASPTATETQRQPTATATATATATEMPVSSDTPTVVPTDTLVPVANQSASASPTSSRGYVSMYMILVSTEGSICGDSAVPVSTGVERYGSVETDVSNALKQLFSTKAEYLGNLLNSLHRSNIRVNNVDFNDKTGSVFVDLRGTYKPTGDPCDNSRVKAQVWSTVRQFKQVKTTDILLNGIPFGDRVSNDK